MNSKHLAIAMILAVLPFAAFADDDLVKAKAQGFSVWKTTQVKGAFNGCVVGKTVNFANGMSFLCTENEHEDDGRTDVSILKHPSGAYKVIIGDEKYEGQLKGKGI